MRHGSMPEMHEPVDGFDGGVYTDGEREFVVVSTHGWAMQDGADWVPAVVFQPRQAEAHEPHSYVVERGHFLKNYTKVDDSNR